jgi:hypothetical protein
MKKETLMKVSYVVFGYVFLAITLVLFIVLDVASLKSNPDVSQFMTFLQSGMPYFLIALTLSGLTIILGILLQGVFLSPLSRTVNMFAFAVLIYFLLTTRYTPLQFQVLAVYAFLIIALLSTYTLVNPILRNYKQFTMVASLRFVTLVVFGIILQLAVLAVNNSQDVANVLAFGFVFAGVTSLFSPLENAKSSTPKKIGKWFGKGTISKIFLGIILAIYLIFIRSRLIELYSNTVMIGEWIFIGLLVLVALFSLRSKLSVVTAPILLESWQKHQQELGFRTTDEFLALSQAIDSFLNSGKKNDLLLFLLRFLSENKVNTENIDSTLDGLINYKDQPRPRLFFSWDSGFLEQEVLQKRKDIVKQIIKNLNADLFRSNLELTSK